MYSTVQSMSERLVRAKMALTNALSEEDIKIAMSELGFDEEKLQAGMVLYNKTEELYQKQKREYTEQFLASEALHKHGVTVEAAVCTAHEGVDCVVHGFDAALGEDGLASYLLDDQAASAARSNISGHVTTVPDTFLL